MKKIAFTFILILSLYNLYAQEITEISILHSSDYTTNDMFGSNVSISGDYYIVGAREEDEDATGTNTVSEAGSAYIFKKISGTWTEIQKIVAPDRQVDDRFGTKVSISGDFAVVSTIYNDYDQNNLNYISNAGAVYIFKNINDNWTFFQKIVPPIRTESQQFGNSIKIIGNNLFIGAPFDKYDADGLNQVNGAGAIYFYEFDNTQWILSQKITAPVRVLNSNFGYDVNAVDDYLFVGAYIDKYDQNNTNSVTSAGSAYIFQLNTGQYQFVQKIAAPDRAEYDRFGCALSGNSQYLVVGAYSEDDDALGNNPLTDAGSAYIFKNVNNDWQFFQKIVQPDRTAGKKFGDRIYLSDNDLFFSVPMENLDINGNNSLTQAGALYHFNFNGTYWEFNQKFTPSDRSYGAAFGSGLSYENKTIIVGASNVNKVYALYFDTFVFSQPENDTVCQNSEVIFGITSSEAQTYQWQIFINSVGWFNVSDDANYTGTNTDTLRIANTPYAFNGNIYRCILSNGVLTKYTDEINLSVDTLIVADAGDNLVLCDLNPFQLSANNPEPNSGYWTCDNTQVIFDNSTAFNTNISNIPLEETTFTWTIDNGACGTSTSEITTILDNLSPETPILADLTGECSATATTPTTTDNCAGTITGTTTDPTEYTEQGTFTITWTFDDGNGNTSTQTQNVVIDDITNPTITCVGNQTVTADNTHHYTVSGIQFDPTATDDNCGVASVINNINNTSTLAGEQLSEGTTTIVWTVTDNAGNTETCSFDVLVNAYVGISDLSANGISVYPNPTNGIVNFDFANNNIQQIAISDIIGKQIIEKTEIQQNEQIDLSSFESGIYIINIQTDKKSFTTKIIKE